MIEIFKTNVRSHKRAVFIIALLRQHFPETEVSFDLSDCDNILRVNGEFCPLTVKDLLKDEGVDCYLLI